ncbi:MAG: DUF6159 family protein [Chloroflexota bacterium]|nr:DUF6159 family protein [Chloroflexota bacterium]
MMERFARSWELVKASWRVLQSDKELIVFPIISFIGAIIVTLLFALPFFGVGIAQATNRLGDDGGVTVIGYIILFLFYIVLYAVIFFCNTALVGAAMIRMNGGDPTVSDGFAIASKKLNHIIAYAIISATVGTILRAISERGGIIGQIASGIFGMAWNVVTFLVVPVLVIEDVGPVDAIKRSGSLLKKTWGEQLIGGLGLGAVFGLLWVVLIFVFMALFIAAAMAESFALMVLVGIVAVLTFITLGMVSSALEGIYQAAVYRYAMGDDVSGFYDPELVSGAFKPKRG